MANFAQGKYQVKNPHKYIGKNQPKYRSGWELTFMMFCDNHDSVISWASEAIKIPYKNPFTGKQTVYVPDFFVMYQDKNGRKIAEVVEIKPKKQSIIESKMNSRDRAVVVINLAKWQAANQWCKRAGLKFRVLTEDQLFWQGGQRNK